MNTFSLLGFYHDSDSRGQLSPWMVWKEEIGQIKIVTIDKLGAEQ